MSYYQDGENFAMRDFSRNVSERRDVYQWLRDFAPSPVWPKIDGEPLQLVYARNGRPETTIDHEGFRRYLGERYHDVADLNRTWNTDYKSFDEIKMTFAEPGYPRAEAIAYQYEIWQREWQKLNRLVEKEFGFPGMRASFDVGYQPYMKFGFSQFARVFGGPHSYGGIFGPPEDQDTERFIQAAVAKKYDTVFFDHFKNHYFDWDIRIPGMAYLPDPYNFDRFWVGALARYSEAVLHLSWNEWWEGSNLEPSREFGKAFCEKNLFYATLMKLSFDSIHNAGRDAPVAVILNDWRFASGAGFEEDLYDTIRVLRRLGVPFDLLPDDFVTAEDLDRFRLVVAPAFDCGLGYNLRREPILDVLTRWLEGGDRRLIVSGHRSVADRFGLRETPGGAPSESKTPGEDLNLPINVGAEGDDRFLRTGYSHREHWGGGPAEERPDAGVHETFRWTPAAGGQTQFVLPASPHRDHKVRIRGRAIWANSLSLSVNSREIATVEIPAGQVRVEVVVPAAAIGAAPMVRLELRYAQRHIPGEVAPQVYKSEGRVCNLALESLQWSTSNVAEDEPEPKFKLVDDSLRLRGETFAGVPGDSIPVPFEARPRLEGPQAEVLSVLEIGDVPRDISLPYGRSKVLYVNGSLAEVQTDDYWLGLITRWAGVEFARFAQGDRVMASRLHSGDTDFVVCFNQDIAETRDVAFSLPARDVPLAEASVLSRDGQGYRPLEATPPGTAGNLSWRTADSLRYYGVYQFVFSPVRIETPELALQPGEERSFVLKLTNLTSQPVEGSIQPASVLPTITGPAVEVSLGPGETKTVPVRINVAPTADWGRKTVYFQLDFAGPRFAGHRAVVLRDLTVLKPAEVELADVILDAAAPRLELRVSENPYGRTAPLAGAKLTFAGQTIDVPPTEEGRSSVLVLPAVEKERVSSSTSATLDPVAITIASGGPGQETLLHRDVFLASRPGTFSAPADAVAALVVYNARQNALEDEPVLAQVSVEPGRYCLRSKEGETLVSQLDASGQLRFLADVPGRSAGTFYLCRGAADVQSDLRVTATDLGSGRGTLWVENSHYSVTLREASGGTVGGLVSRKTGRDYGHDSFGVNYGTFSRHDPAEPQTDTTRFIRESKTRQADSPATIEIVSQGPAALVALVRWRDEKVEVDQRYDFPAKKPYFVIRQTVRPIDLGDVQELVALDARFKPHRLNKSWPDFVGMPNGLEQPHFGWRQGDWIPPYASLIAHPEFDESISLVITQNQGLHRIRQGFWPENRPQPGKCDRAEIELLADLITGCQAEVYVLLHAGHQIVAERFLSDWRVTPRVDVVGLPLSGRRESP
jgi:hypothetical protein